MSNFVINKNIPDKGFTHAGIFHADDVFATAFLMILNPAFSVYRGNVIPENFDGIIYDIGRGRFDHHQEGSEVRENGVPFAAFGLVWREFALCMMSETEAEILDNNFVQIIDETDNTGKYNAISEMISEFNPRWDETAKSQDSCFMEAVVCAKGILERKILDVKSKTKAYELVKKQVEEKADKASRKDGRFLVMRKCIPWKQALIDTNILYVIFPSLRGGYMIQAVPESVDTNAVKKAFPEEWRGKNREELEKLTGITEFSFCHNAGFICAAETLDGAKKIARLAVG